MDVFEHSNLRPFPHRGEGTEKTYIFWHCTVLSPLFSRLALRGMFKRRKIMELIYAEIPPSLRNHLPHSLDMSHHLCNNEVHDERSRF